MIKDSKPKIKTILYGKLIKCLVRRNKIINFSKMSKMKHTIEEFERRVIFLSVSYWVSKAIAHCGVSNDASFRPISSCCYSSFHPSSDAPWLSSGSLATCRWGPCHRRRRFHLQICCCWCCTKKFLLKKYLTAVMFLRNGHIPRSSGKGRLF